MAGVTGAGELDAKPEVGEGCMEELETKLLVTWAADEDEDMGEAADVDVVVGVSEVYVVVADGEALGVEALESTGDAMEDEE